jgi:hypothetical protein
MKNILILFGILVLASCSKEDDIFKLDEVELSGQESRSIVAKLEHDLNAADPTTAVKFTKSELTIIDNQYYLVASNDTYTSTTLLRKGKDNQLVSAGIHVHPRHVQAAVLLVFPNLTEKAAQHASRGIVLRR